MKSTSYIWGVGVNNGEQGRQVDVLEKKGLRKIEVTSGTRSSHDMTLDNNNNNNYENIIREMALST